MSQVPLYGSAVNKARQRAGPATREHLSSRLKDLLGPVTRVKKKKRPEVNINVLHPKREDPRAPQARFDSAGAGVPRS